VLLGFLPLSRSRHSNSASLAAGCGQLFLTTRDAYRRAGGHYAIKSSLHDGIMLPRLFRRAGLRTDIFDASDLASCRMYDTNRDVLQGLMKNATEGIGSPKTIIPFTLLLGGGQSPSGHACVDFFCWHRPIKNDRLCHHFKLHFELLPSLPYTRTIPTECWECPLSSARSRSLPRHSVGSFRTPCPRIQSILEGQGITPPIGARTAGQ